MTAIHEPVVNERSSIVRWSFGWFLAIATAVIIAHGLGCHGDDIDHEPTVYLNDEARP